MGRLLAPFGVDGRCRLRPYTAAPDAMLNYPHWLLAPGAEGPWREYRVLDARLHGEGIVAALDGVGTREEAQALRGWLAGVPRAALPDAGKDEWYWADLVGLAVVNRAGSALGRVSGLIETGAHPVLRVADEAGERLIPLVAAYVDAIEPAAGRIVVDWPEDY